MKERAFPPLLASALESNSVVSNANENTNILDKALFSGGVPDLVMVGDLNTLYQSLPKLNKKHFKRIFLAIYKYMVPFSRFQAANTLLITSFALPLVLKDYKISLDELAALSLVYHLTSGGKKSFHSSLLVPYYGASSSQHLVRLEQLGYVRRSHINPDQPYNIVYEKGPSKKFIELTGSGYQFYYKSLPSKLSTKVSNILADISKTTHKNSKG